MTVLQVSSQQSGAAKETGGGRKTGAVAAPASAAVAEEEEEDETAHLPSAEMIRFVLMVILYTTVFHDSSLWFTKPLT